MINIIDFVPDIRLGKYGPPDDPMTYEKYFFNIQLCESLYPTLRMFEIILRNKIDLVLSMYIGPDWIIDVAGHDVGLYIGKQYNHHDVIEKLPFAFWAGLLQSDHRPMLWFPYPGAFQAIFEKCHSRDRMGKIPYEIDQLRKYRNCVAHNGYILSPESHQIPCDAMHGIGMRLMRDMGAKAAVKHLKSIDRFPMVLANGIERGFLTGLHVQQNQSDCMTE